MGVDFDETFTPVAKLQSLHMMLALAAVTAQISVLGLGLAV